MQEKCNSAVHVVAVSPMWDAVHHTVCTMNDDLVHTVHSCRAVRVVDTRADNVLQKIVVHEDRVCSGEDAVVKLCLPLADYGLLALPPALKVLPVHKTAQPTRE